jgi:hypothetical protein
MPALKLRRVHQGTYGVQQLTDWSGGSRTSRSIAAMSRAHAFSCECRDPFGVAYTACPPSSAHIHMGCCCCSSGSSGGGSW